MRRITQALQGSALLQALNPQIFTGSTSDTNGTTTSKTSGGVGKSGTLAMLAAAPLTAERRCSAWALAAGLGGSPGAGDVNGCPAWQGRSGLTRDFHRWVSILSSCLAFKGGLDQASAKALPNAGMDPGILCRVQRVAPSE